MRAAFACALAWCACSNSAPTNVGDAAMCAPIAPTASGWVHVDAVGPCCRLDAVASLSTIPKLSWVQCTSGRAGCMQLSDGSSSNELRNHTGDDAVRVSFAADGTPSLLVLTVTPPQLCCGEDIYVYDLATLTPLAGWREDLEHCYAVIRPADGVLAFDVHRYLDDKKKLGTDAMTVGTPSVLASSLDLRAVPDSLLPNDDSISDIAVSGTTVAFVSRGHRAARAPRSASTFIPFDAERVWAHADDVFASNDGSISYVAADGAVAALIPRPAGGDVEDFAMDDATIVWTASSSTNPGAAWKSPYARDNASLMATTIAVPNAQTATLLNGTFGGTSGTAAVVARVSDNAAQSVVALAGELLFSRAYFTNGELWVVGGGPVCLYTGCDSEMSLIRITMSPWP